MRTRGHPSPLLAHDGTVDELDGTGPIVGPVVTTWMSAETTLRPGAVLAVYTDGLTDPRNMPDGLSALDVLTDLVAGADRPEAEVIVARSLEELDVHAVGRPRDDVPLVVLSRVG